MLEDYYKDRRTLVDFRHGPLGPHFDGFATSLKEKGYSSSTVTDVLSRCCQFNHYLVEHGVKQARAIVPAMAEPFLKAYLEHWRTSAHYSARAESARALGHLFSYLVTRGVMRRNQPRPAPSPWNWILDPYLKYLREERELTDRTIAASTKMACAFLKGLGNQTSRQAMQGLKPEVIEEYIKRHFKDSPENRQRLTSTLRGFLRFCAVKGYIGRDLSGLVPTVPRYRLSSLPRGIEDEAVERLLAAIPRDSTAGCRDYAIVLLLAVYGVRAAQIGKLRLEDIHWPRSTIRIGAAKGGKEVLLPLLGPVGEALLSYLRHRPTDSVFRELFLKVHAPLGPLDTNAISRTLRAHMAKAGVKIPRAGVASLRHSWAIRALANDAPIKAIADVLGHRCLHTTFIYAKADLKTLRKAAAAWPEVTR
jgi:integrase/recombinase XerD